MNSVNNDSSIRMGAAPKSVREASRRKSISGPIRRSDSSEPLCDILPVVMTGKRRMSMPSMSAMSGEYQQVAENFTSELPQHCALTSTRSMREGNRTRLTPLSKGLSVDPPLPSVDMDDELMELLDDEDDDEQDMDCTSSESPAIGPNGVASTPSRDQQGNGNDNGNMISEIVYNYTPSLRKNKILWNVHGAIAETSNKKLPTQYNNGTPFNPSSRNQAEDLCAFFKRSQAVADMVTNNDNIDDVDVRFAQLMGHNPEIAHDLFVRYGDCETAQMNDIDADYLQFHPEVDPKIIFLLCDWMNQICEEFELRTHVWNVAISMFHRFMSKTQNIRVSNLQILGTACVMIAAKVESVHHPRVQCFMDISHDAFTKEDLIRCEMLVWQTLDYNVTEVTAQHFLKRLFMASNSNPRESMLAYYIAECALVQYAMIGYKPSLIAASALALARLCISADPGWNATLQHYSNLEQPDLDMCVQDMYSAVNALRNTARATGHSSIQIKFSNYENHLVGAIEMVDYKTMCQYFPGELSY